MTMKVNFHLTKKKTVSSLTQIASVSYSKDKSIVLRATILDPIGAGLQWMRLGGHFKVIDNEFTLEFSLSNTTEQSVKIWVATGACDACFIPQNRGHLEKTLILSLNNRSSVGQ